MPDDRKQALRDHLAAARAKLDALAARLGADDWERPVQSEGEHWTARQMLAHLLSAETGQLATLKGIADGGPGVKEGFDLDRWNNKQVAREAARTPEELLAALGAARRDTLAAIEALSDEQMARTGRHARGDVLSVEQIFYRIGEHE